MGVSLITDDSSDISKELARKVGIELLFCSVDWPEGEKIEGNDIYEKMKKSKTYPKTSAVSTGEFKRSFEKILEKGDDVVCITPSMKISAISNSAHLARSFLPKIYQDKVFIFDSELGLGAVGLLVLKGASFAQQGKSAKEIVDILKNKYQPNTHLAGIMGSMKWVEAGGRISHSFSLLAEYLAVLKIRPILGIQNGKIKPTGVKINVGSFSEAIFDFFKNKIKDMPPSQKFDFFISYTDNLSEGKKIRNLLENEPFTGKIYLGKLNPVVGSHCGPGTLYLSWSIE